jgi:hypothetical protein
MFKNKEMERWAVYITSKTFCDEGVNKVVMAHI